MLNSTKLTSLANRFAVILLAALLTACGGGGRDDGCLNLDPSRSSALPSCGGTSANTGSNPGPSAGALTMDTTDISGAASINVAPDNPLTVKTTLKNSSGAAVPNAVVTFASTDSTAVFSPASATALTDASGVASIRLSAGTQAGAFTLSATSVVGTNNLKASKNYTVSFPFLTLSDIQLTPSTLPAGGNASVSVTVMNGSVPYPQPVSVAFNTPCVQSGKAVIGTPVITQNGIAIASYTDKGCSSSDTVTATVILPNATLSKSAVITVLPAAAGSLKFVSATPSNIALVGTGGVDRPEVSTLKFQVLDQNGSPLAGKQVSFKFNDSNATTTTGGLQLSPSSATTAQDGTITTSVGGGTIPTSVRVIATATNSSPMLTTTSSLLVVSSGVPDQNHFSIAVEVGNCEGFNYDLTCTVIRTIVGDHFGNAVPDGTAVNFSTEGGVVEPSCLTVAGTCTVKLWSANPRPINGRTTVLGYALGEESFIDANGNNMYDPGEQFDDRSPDIYRDDDENGTWSPGEPCIGPNTTKSCNTPGDGLYNGVLNKSQPRTPQVLYVARQLVVQFSGSHANVTTQPATLACPANGTMDVGVTIKDDRGLWMPADTKVTFAAVFGTQSATVTPSTMTVPNVVLAVGSPANVPTYVVTVQCPPTTTAGNFIVTVTTPLNNTTISKTPIN